MASSEPRRRVSRQASKLSDERLARKRALDREAQRHSRSKTKNHIALLESRIEALTRVKANGDTKELVDKIEEQRRENEQLKSTLKTIGKIVGGDVVGGMLETSNSTSTLMKKPSTPESEDNYEQVPTTAENEQQVESIDLGELPEGLELPESCSLSQDVVRKSVEGNHGMGTDTQLQLTNGAMDFSFDPRSPSYDIPFNFQTSLFNRPRKYRFFLSHSAISLFAVPLIYYHHICLYPTICTEILANNHQSLVHNRPLHDLQMLPHRNFHLGDPV